MHDNSFLPHFITEDIYIIKEDLVVEQETADPNTENAEQPTVETSVTTAAPIEHESPTVEEAPAASDSVDIVREPEPVYLKPLPTEGNNLKHCLVLVESEQEILEAELKGLLEKIMGAVKRGLDDILLVNVREASEDQLEALLSEQNHRHLLSFGSQKLPQLSEVGKYEITEINKKYYLKADSLIAISQDIGLKKALWAALKEMF